MSYLGLMEIAFERVTGGRVVPQWTVADRLRKARELTGLTQAQFGEILYLTRKQVSNVESGITSAKKELLIKWAIATGIDLEWLKTGKGGPDGPPPGDSLPDLDSNQEPSGSFSGNVIEVNFSKTTSSAKSARKVA